MWFWNDDHTDKRARKINYLKHPVSRRVGVPVSEDRAPNGAAEDLFERVLLGGLLRIGHGCFVSLMLGGAGGGELQIGAGLDPLGELLAEYD